MLDRLMPVGGECTRRPAELPVEVDGGGQGKDPRDDAADEAVGSLGEVVFEPELLFERVDDRLDPLADGPDRGRCSLWLVTSTGTQQQPAELGDSLLEVGAGEALVGDYKLPERRLAFEPLEHRLALSWTGGHEVGVAHAAVRPAAEVAPKPPVEARVGGRIAEAS